LLRQKKDKKGKKKKLHKKGLQNNNWKIDGLEDQSSPAKGRWGTHFLGENRPG